MNNHGGFTRSYRRKWDNPVFANKQQAAVWAWMCDVAQWRPTVIGTKWGAIELRRGELVIAERVIAEDFGMHRNTLRGLLNRMVDEGMIRLIRDRIPHRCGTIVSIVKYAEYQGINGVHYEHEDHTSENPGPYAGPHEDHIRTENNYPASQELTGGALCVSLESTPCAPACEADTHTAPPTGSSKVVQFVKKGGPEVLPAGWVPSDGQRALALDLGHPDIDMAALRFREHWITKADNGERGAAKSAAGWADAWEWWVRDDIKRALKGKQGHGKQRIQSPATGANATAQVLAEILGRRA